MHHHKDHMLAAGSTPSTIAYMYETPTTQKSEMSMAKSDYSSFTTCVQQSALLDHRTAIDANLDAGVSLGALCDLKFSGGGGPIGATLENDTTQTSNYKVLPPLMAGIEANQIMTGLQKVNATTPTCINVPTFSDILFARDATPKSSTTAISQQHYLTLKGNEVQNTAESTQQQQHYITNTEIATTTTKMSPPNEFIGRGMNASGRSVEGNFGNNLLEYGIASLSSSASHNLNNSSEYSTNHNGLNIINNRSLNENHITTSTATTIAAATTITNIRNQTANNTPNQSQHQQQQQHATTSSTRTTLHSIEELAASSCTPTSSTNSSINTFFNNNNNNAASSTATSVPLNNINNANDEHQQPQQQQEQQHHSQDNMPNSSNNPQQQHLLHQQELQQQQHRRQQLQHQQQLLHSSTISSDSNDSISSSDEFIDMELNERSGYQDTTSTHSQHITNGGGIGNNRSSMQQLSSNPAGVSLSNGVVTINSQNAALTGGSHNGGSSASGIYMSLLPPNVGATSSSAPHLDGAVKHLGGGTSTSASDSGPDVTDFKHLFDELCPVCGDKVSGYHYGLLTCESCKGFFKRTVQNKKVYTCVAERSCHIDKTQRKRCPYCRFQKCLEVGMKLEAVRADRMRGGRNKFGPMYKRDRARKFQVMRQRQVALQALRTSMGTGDMKATPLSAGYQEAYASTNMNIKQEIQIPQVSSLTKSPDSSTSPIAIALGQFNTSSGKIATPLNGSSGADAGGGVGGAGGGEVGGGGKSGNNNSSNTYEGLNRVGSGSGGGSANCHKTDTGSLQSASDSKQCCNSTTHPLSSDSIIEPLRISPMIRDFVQSIDDREWQTQLFALLQKQTHNQVEVDLFELMCKVLDQHLFSQVDWARNTVFFKDLKVDDQMKLLQHSWSDMLILDHLHQRIHNDLPDETQLNNGQVFDLLSLGLLGVPQLSDYFNALQNKLQDLKFDMGDYVCMKLLILLNPDVRGIIDKNTVSLGQENVQAALLDYTLTCYPSVVDKFRRLLSMLPEIHAMASRGEEHLYSKHCAGSAPTQTLLMEMLHAKLKVYNNNKN